VQNLRKHRVDFADAATAFEYPRALTRDDPHPREERVARRANRVEALQYEEER